MNGDLGNGTKVKKRDSAVHTNLFLNGLNVVERRDYHLAGSGERGERQERERERRLKEGSGRGSWVLMKVISSEIMA